MLVRSLHRCRHAVAHTAAHRHPRGAQQAARRCQHQVCRAAVAAAVEAELPAELTKIVAAFQSVPDARLKYQQLLTYGKRLELLPAEDHTEDNKVRGCVSQVWVKPELRGGLVYWRADSDSALTKGLAALLVQGLSGASAEQIARMPPDWITALGLQQSLTPSRNNGFLNMFRLMQQKALQLLAEAAAPPQAQSQPLEDPPAPPSAPEAAASRPGAAAAGGAEPGAEPAPQIDEARFPVRAAVDRKLRAALRPQRLEVIDESQAHAGHAGVAEHDSPSGESHFKVVVVSQKLEGLNRVQRHRAVYGAISEEMAGKIHALTMDLKTPEEALRTAP